MCQKRELDMSNFTEGQIHQLADAFETAGYTKEHLTKFGQFPDHSLILGVLDGTHEIILKNEFWFRETNLLRPVATSVVSGDDILDEDAFFRTREGEILVTPSFREKFGNTFQKSHVSSRLHVACELKRNAYDTAIRTDLPKSHLSKLGDIARLIKTQRGGKSGILLNNGCGNIFFVKAKNGEVFVVRVYWNDDVRVWYVHDLRLDERGRHSVSHRVFFAGNAAL
jgi:hypothetical protein